jgi:hypothetical protein
VPEIANLHFDPAALIALGFLGAVLVLTLGLFGWLAVNMAKRRRASR